MRNLYFRLPPQSHTNWEIADVPEEARLWDINTYMLANLIDAIMALDWHFISANSRRAPRPPKPFDRPKTKKVEKKKKGFWPGKTIMDKGVNND